MKNTCLGSKINQKRIAVILYISIAIMTVLLNALAWSSTAFCDAYIAFVFPMWVNTYGRVTGMFAFSVGEWLLVAGVILIVVAVVLLPVVLFRWILTRRGRDGGVNWLAIRKFYIFFAWILLAVCLVMTLNCSILYHATPFSEKYFGETQGHRALSEEDERTKLEELFRVRNLVAKQCNVLSEQVERDAEGMPVYLSEQISSLAELKEPEGEHRVKMVDKAREMMQQLGKTYDQLDGWYPRPKPMFFSDFMCQQHMEGYYFPFSMEANYNDVMNEILKPACMCHELAHLRGYIFEDEANFIAYMACVQSDDSFFRYSGYLSVLNYLNNDLYGAYQKNSTLFAEVAEEIPPVIVDSRVHEDNTFVSDEEWDRINGKALLDTEVVDAAADVYLDVTLKANGVSDGKISYSRVVELLLLYYRMVDEDNCRIE